MIFVAVDVSGSVSDELYMRLVGLITNFMEKVEKVQRMEGVQLDVPLAWVLFFSDKLIDVKQLEPGKIPPLPRLETGGAKICDTIDYINQHMNDNDFVAVLSDFEIADDKECMNTIERIGTRTSAALQVVPSYGDTRKLWNNWRQVIYHETPRDKTLWIIAKDIVINEKLLSEYEKNADKKTIDELKSIIATRENLNKKIKEACTTFNIQECDKYILTEQDLKSDFPEYRIYHKLLVLVNKYPQIKKMIEVYAYQFHRPDDEI